MVKTKKVPLGNYIPPGEKIKIPEYSNPINFQYTKDFNFFLHEFATLKSDSNVATNNTQTLYTCPIGSVFYVLSVELQMSALAAINNDTTLQIKGADVLRLRPNSTQTHGSESLNFSTPLKLVPGDTIKVFSGAANLNAVGTYVGYEITIVNLQLFNP